MAQLVFEKAGFGYGSRNILMDINLEIKQGDFFGLVGPNGAGKTTLIKAMLGLIKPRHGTVRWMPSIPKRGYVPQKEQIDPIWPMRVRDLLKHTRNASEKGILQRHEQRAVMEVMEQTGTMHLANQTLDTLSGGEMQRVLLARALVVDPEVLLLDEPTAAMDLVASLKFLTLITGLHHRRNITVIIVTHDLPSLVDRAHSLGIIQHGLLHSGPTSELMDSKTLSSIYRVPMNVKKVEGQTMIIPLQSPEEAEC